MFKVLPTAGYSFQTFADFIRNPKDRVVVMRHDVDRLPGNALTMAKIEREMGIGASYYFRAVPVSWDEQIILEIAGLGHEIGYHYENIDSVIREGKRRRKSFVRESARIREGKYSLAYRQGNNSTACGGSGGLPDKIMFNVHPQRWHDRSWPWVRAPVKFAKAGTVVHFTG